MSAWSSQPGTLDRRRSPGALAELTLSLRRLKPRTALWIVGLLCVLVAEGLAVERSYLWAAPLVGVLVAAVAVDLPIVPFLGLTLLVRILADASLSSAVNRHSGSVNLSGAMAIMFMLVALGLLVRRRRGMLPTALAMLWLCVWTVVATRTHGTSTETIREGVREASIVAFAVIVCNARGALNVAVVTRLIQFIGAVSALIALYQFGTHSGMLIGGKIRANGTFSHPNGAAMFFAIATTASMWRYVDHGRQRIDALFIALFAAATIATFSIGGVASLMVMLMTFGSMRPGAIRLKLGSCAAAVLIVAAFLATPLGAERIASETSTEFSSAREHLKASTSLGWRFYKWTTLIPEWEASPYFGQGLGTTVTAEGTSENTTAGKVPHNEYVRYLVETGAFGLVILLTGVVILIRRLARRRKIASLHNAGALGLAVTAGCLFNALGDNTFLYTTTGYAAALIVAAVLCLPIDRASRAVTRTAL
jgi:O-Antigen ligase